MWQGCQIKGKSFFHEGLSVCLLACYSFPSCRLLSQTEIRIHLLHLELRRLDAYFSFSISAAPSFPTWPDSLTWSGMWSDSAFLICSCSTTILLFLHLCLILSRQVWGGQTPVARLPGQRGFCSRPWSVFRPPAGQCCSGSKIDSLEECYSD